MLFGQPDRPYRGSSRCSRSCIGRRATLHPCTMRAMVNWETIRGAYIDHFVSVVGVRVAGQVGGVDPSFYVLHFVRPDAVSHVYATFGASHGALEHEIAIISAGP